MIDRPLSEHDGRNVHALLNLAQNLHKQAAARVSTGDLNRLVSETSDLLFRTIGATVRIETVLTERLWPALVDPTQIEIFGGPERPETQPIHYVDGKKPPMLLTTGANDDRVLVKNTRNL